MENCSLARPLPTRPNEIPPAKRMIASGWCALGWPTLNRVGIVHEPQRRPRAPNAAADGPFGSPPVYFGAGWRSVAPCHRPLSFWASTIIESISGCASTSVCYPDSGAPIVAGRRQARICRLIVHAAPARRRLSVGAMARSKLSTMSAIACRKLAGREVLRPVVFWTWQYPRRAESRQFPEWGFDAVSLNGLCWQRCHAVQMQSSPSRARPTSSARGLGRPRHCSTGERATLDAGGD